MVTFVFRACLQTGQIGTGIGFTVALAPTDFAVNNLRDIAMLLFLAGKLEKKPGQFLIKQQVSIEIEGESTPALIAEWLTMAITK